MFRHYTPHTIIFALLLAGYAVYGLWKGIFG